MTVKEFLKATYKICCDECIKYQEVRPHVTCKDGFSISIQAGNFHYSIPKKILESGEYHYVELGFPSENDELVEGYKEGDIYPYVPIEIVEKLIEKHGGMKELRS